MHARWVVLSVLAAGCPPPDPVEPRPDFTPPPQEPAQPTLDLHSIDFRFEGGHVDLELWRQGTRITQYARNRYAVPIVLRWSIPTYWNVQPQSPIDGVVLLPPADKPGGQAESVPLAELVILDPRQRYHRDLTIRAKFGDPRARPSDYAYRLPYPAPLAFSVLQGFHGTFSHRGSNEYAIDFDCPVATPVLAARPGIVVASHAAAQGSGTTHDILENRRTNFLIELHEDGTLSQYIHLAPRGVLAGIGH